MSYSHSHNPAAPQVIGPYTVIGVLGSGGFATVYKVRSPQGTELALKLVLAKDPGLLARFDREQRMLEELNKEPGFVLILDRGVSPMGPYLVMPILGRSLADRLKHEGPMTIEAALELLTEIASALAQAHKRGIIHRDLKPHNILFDSQGQPQIADFGLAKHTQEARARLAHSVSLSQGGETYGTVAYMPPEQVDGFSEVGPAADVFSLTVILYECLTCELPFGRDNAMAVAMRMGRGQFRPLSAFRDDCPPQLMDFIETGLQAEPSERFQSGEDFAEALEQLLDEGIAERPEKPWTLWALIVTSVVLAFSLGFVYVARSRSAPPKPLDKQPPEKQDPRPEDQAPKPAPEASAKTPPEPKPLTAAEVPAALAKAVEQPGLKLLKVLGEFRARHSALVASVAVSPDGLLLASGGFDGSARLWEAATGRELRCFSKPGTHCGRVRFSSDGRFLGMAFGDGHFVIYNLKTKAKPARIKFGQRDLKDFQFIRQDQVIAVTVGPKLRLFDLKAGRVIRTYSPHDPKRGPLMRVAYSGKHNYFVTAVKGEVLFWNEQKTLFRATINATPHALCFDEARQRALVGDSSGQAYLLDHANRQGKAFKALTENLSFNHVRALAFLSEDQIIVGGDDFRLRVWSLQGLNFKPVDASDRQVNWIHDLVLTPDGQRVLTGSNDQNLELWDLKTLKKTWKKSGHRGQVSGFFEWPEQKLIFSLAMDRDLRFWDWPSGEALSYLTYQLHRPKILEDKHNRCLLLYGYSPEILELSLTGLSDKRRFPRSAYSKIMLGGPESRLRLTHLTVMGDSLVGVSQSGYLYYWERGTGKFRGRSGQKIGQNLLGLFSDSHDKLVVLPFRNGLVELLNVDSRRVAHRLRSEGPSYCVGFNDAARSLALAKAEGRIEVWSLERSRKRLELHAPNRRVGFRAKVCALSDDGLWLAAASSRWLLLWSLEKRELHAEIDLSKCHHQPSALRFESSNRHLLLGSSRGVILRFAISSDGLK